MKYIKTSSFPINSVKVNLSITYSINRWSWPWRRNSCLLKGVNSWNLSRWLVKTVKSHKLNIDPAAHYNCIMHDFLLGVNNLGFYSFILIIALLQTFRACLELIFNNSSYDTIKYLLKKSHICKTWKLVCYTHSIPRTYFAKSLPVFSTTRDKFSTGESFTDSTDG